MNMTDIIRKKRDGAKLSTKEIRFWIDNYVEKKIPDYQSAALLMAIYFSGLTVEETVELTFAMRDSGALVDLSPIGGVKVDKHSTGGVGDKTTLVVAPIIAAAGLKVAKMSGRSLDFTGGTLDKLESIKDLRVGLTLEEFIRQVNKCGVAIIGQTAELAYADKLLYALRDVTATVDSVSLIAASIMSKKLAVGADVLVLDIKYGSGAFFKTSEAASEAANIMVGIGRAAGQHTTAIISAMEQPLGQAVGNALEVIEAVQVLGNKGPADVRELSLALAAEAIYLAGFMKSRKEAMVKAGMLLDSGAALGKFKEMIEAQGGDSDFAHLPISRLKIPYYAKESGYICKLDAELIGRVALALGAGRSVKEAAIDHSAGIFLLHKLGDYVHKGEEIALLHSNDEKSVEKGVAVFDHSLTISQVPPNVLPLINKVV
ncbi:MAG: thymidine phosphorylase [Clostridiales bacterium]|nr:thymidine phosphorylase [Clostridiales bacterium]